MWDDIVDKAYKSIDWSNIPKSYTSFGDTNMSTAPKSIDERIINMEEGENNEKSLQSY